MQKLTLSLTLIGITLAFNSWASDPHAGMHQMPDGTWMHNHDMQPTTPTTTDAVVKTIVATVNGLVCDFCAQGVKKMLLKQPHVSDVVVDLTAKTVVIKLTHDKVIPEDTLAKLLKDAGYDMTSYKVN